MDLPASRHGARRGSRYDDPVRAALKEASFPFLSRLSRESRGELDALSGARAAAGARLLRRGDIIDAAYLVTSGALRVYYVTAEGREATLYHVEPGGLCVLSFTSVVNQEPYPAWVEAGREGGEFVRVPRAAFMRLLDSEPAFRQYVFSALSGRVFELMRALEEAGSAQMEERVSRFLLRRQGVDGCVRITQEALASELGTAREVVFRALRSLAGRGLIQTGRMRIRVLDRPGLQSAATRTELIAT